VTNVANVVVVGIMQMRNLDETIVTAGYYYWFGEFFSAATFSTTVIAG